MGTDVVHLVDADRGLISKRIFIEREIYQQELERIFARCWLFLCHESQIPQPGRLLHAPPWARTRSWWCATPTARSTPS